MQQLKDYFNTGFKFISKYLPFVVLFGFILNVFVIPGKFMNTVNGILIVIIIFHYVIKLIKSKLEN